MEHSPRLLFISPVVPAQRGNGLSMRAANVLLALSRRFRVTLLVTMRYVSEVISTEIERVCRQVVILPAHQAVRISIALDDAPFDVVHVFRLGTVPLAEPYLDRSVTGERWLDLDDVESETLRRMAALRRLHGDVAGAMTEDEQSIATEAAESTALARFDRVFVCSAGDIPRLPTGGSAQVTVLPNALPIPGPIPARPENDPAGILFVGTLGYYPNAEGVHWFVSEVLPILARRLDRPAELWIVGAGSSPILSGLQPSPDWRLIGSVPAVRPWYERCQLVVAPIRAGGGTRIKMLEAFSLRRPVVSTTIGVEGIDARDGEHVLVADDPDEFAAACQRLIDDRALGDRLTEQAYGLFSERYTAETTVGIVSALATLPPPRRESRSDDRSPAPR